MSAHLNPAVLESIQTPEFVGGNVIDGAARRLIFKALQRLDTGDLTLREGADAFHFGGTGGPNGFGADLAAVVNVHSPRLYRRTLTDGTNGVAESFMRGEFTCDDLVSMLRIFLASAINKNVVGYGSRFKTLVARCANVSRRNSKTGSKRNIADHYDLSNNFFKLWLDETMSYSAGIFESPTATMADASRAKNDRMCRKLALTPDDHLLEIGTGWGEMAIHAAKHFGCRVTTTTISEQQHHYAKQRIEAEGLSDRITLLKRDYRDLTGKYDKIVSVEMIEAVGHEYYGTFFRKCCDLLKPNGALMMQAIVIADEAYDEARRAVDFIKRYIFPGSCIPSVAKLTTKAAGSSDLRLRHLEDITPHYAETLRRWRITFMEKADEVRALGFDERFMKMWEFYLAYCEAGFHERHISDVQMLFVRPQHRGDMILPRLG